MSSPTLTLLSNLNKQQQAAVEHTEGPLLVLAGAGSGKTRTITYKVAYLIERELCRPDQILAVTFTNKAAEEMTERVTQLVAGLEFSPRTSTFHSFCLQMLRRYADRIGYGRDFTILDSDDQRTLYKHLYREEHLDPDELPIRKVQSVISHAKNEGLQPAEYRRRANSPEAALIEPLFLRYQEALRQSNAMDFDDLILNGVRLLEEDEKAREKVAGWYKYLLVDEYQDTNATQYRLLKELTRFQNNITAVGDEDQSIYRFRGADIGNILRFEKDFPGARIIKLEENYRSTQTILEASTAVVSNNTQRKGKILWTSRKGGDLIEIHGAETAWNEADFIARKIYQRIQLGESDIGVLYRTNFQSRHFEETFRRNNIPYRLVGGVSFYSRKEVKDILAYLRCSANQHDSVSLQRIINEPARGIGKVTLEKLQENASERSCSLWDSLQIIEREGLLNARTRTALRQFVEIIENCRRALETRPLHLAVQRVLELSGYARHLKDQQTEEAENRRLNLDELTTVAQEFHQRGEGLIEFLDNCALYSETDELDQSDGVLLMTLHNAKGLEFDTVFLAGCEEGLFPHSRSVTPEDLEEERRLCYVGMTRARRQLYMTFCRRRRMFGNAPDRPTQHSPFLNEIPSQLTRDTSSPVRPAASSFEGVYPKRPQREFAGKTYNSPESVGKFLEKLPRKSDSKNALRPGVLVEHSKFGRGKILQVEPGGGDLRITVNFPGTGIKKLLQSYAQLRPI